MKFLFKYQDSPILKEGITYQENKPENNRKLREMLLKEQKGFCAYTEKFIQLLDSPEVEHFNPHIKYKDDYFNYYAVIRKANQFKNNNPNADARFFKTRFFQKKDEFDSRITIKEGLYFALNDSDSEAVELIDFLNLNHPDLYQQRSKHVKRISEVFDEAKYDNAQRIEYFKEHKDELSFITAIEEKLKIDLEHIL